MPDSAAAHQWNRRPSPYHREARGSLKVADAVQRLDVSAEDRWGSLRLLHFAAASTSPGAAPVSIRPYGEY